MDAYYGEAYEYARGRDYTWRKDPSLQIMGVNTGLRIWPKDNASIGFRVRNPVDSGCCNRLFCGLCDVVVLADEDSVVTPPPTAEIIGINYRIL